ncbi:MAG: type II secretion system GspH family protein [Candidatus Doudnabacteria bacterium]|nr:type II secretion system GspH family protein [Candidatus Doudnabacteria bacterium]
MSLQSKKNGFGIIELLVILSVAGLSVSLIFYILGSIKFKQQDIQKLHDARRLSDMTQVRTGLDIFLSQAGGYPDVSLWQSGKIVGCKSAQIFQPPHDPAGTNYIYQTKGKSISSTDCGKVWPGYTIQFTTEGKTSIGLAGTYCLTADRGIIPSACPK